MDDEDGTALSEDSDDDEPTSAAPGKTRTVTSVVKCALVKTLNMPTEERARFVKNVDEFVCTLSRMMRQASIGLLYHLTATAERGERIPDLLKKTTNGTYWRRWLHLDVEDIVSTDDWGFINSSAVRDVGVECNLPGINRPCSYSAITFATAVQNNAWVPLVPRVIRLTKAVVTRCATDSDEKKLCRSLVSKIRGIRSPDVADLPPWASDHVLGVRARLGMDGTSYLFDDYGKRRDFHDLFMFNYWMQQRFTDLEQPRLALSPVFNVRRQHVRLDKTTLVEIACSLFPGRNEVVAYKSLVSRSLGPPTAPSLNDKRCVSCQQLGKSRPKCVGCSERKVDVQVAYAESMVAFKAAKPSLRATLNAGISSLKKSDAYRTSRAAVYRNLFVSNIPGRAGSGWSFDGSITTDGVAVSLQFSKRVPKAEKPSISGAKKAPPVVEETYDQHLPTSVSGADGRSTIVAGNDPGRTIIASVAVLDENGKPHVWKLSRGQYYTDAGIKKQELLKKRRDAALQPKWRDLGGSADDDADTSALRTASSADIASYVAKYEKVRLEWWSHALQRRESRDAFQRVIGKRSVLDRFWVGVKRGLEALFPMAEKRIIAYGSAYATMASSGRGEVAVPTTGAFTACRRIFGASGVAVVDEHRTTVFDWETGKRNTEVYRKRDGVGVSAGAVTVSETAAARRANGKPMVVRGLRFSPERRLFLNRDAHSAVTIARLHVMELYGLGRPRPFARTRI
jgi:hypothetical protein